jgi:prepilin-type N-terminal cleavage/methylation domain-containing protein
MKTKMSNKAGFGLREVMVVVAVIGLLAPIAVRQIEGAHQPCPLDMTQLLTRLKWIWTAVFVSSTVAALTFVWLRASAQSGKHLQNLIGKQREELQLQ